ncbi:hypothetical protein [Roseisolibacter sp. H3M3-2]|uniref:hypothetical protein n=1 Tax=Roseisolibacter sp. H3M3-2 TaxID=3031323 RepID=UPI0023DB151A|nr:hypothetical protein [Roseisolibacter sp. H3M3-2]MDF1504479.1 hypothetical protein [Roseisolibacter sp. H3M3-2]
MTPRRLLLPALLTLAAPAHAQDRLLGLRAAGAGATFETLRLGDGVRQASLLGGDSLRVRTVMQLSVPVTAVTPIGGAWTLDATTVYGTGEVEYDDAGGARRTATLAGVSDVRLRATGRLFDEALLVTVGANVPTGRTELDAEQLTALRALAAPAFGMIAPPVGQGPSGTLGLLLARQAGGWALAAGASYEYRGEFAPVAALVAGAPSVDFRPGGVIRGSLGADRPLGAHRLSVAVSAEVFAEDRLRAGATATAPASGLELAAVQLGPVVTTDVQLQLGAPRLRELVLWGTNRWRARFSRDGVTVPGSSGNYLDGGVRMTAPVTARTDVFTALDGRWHSGLDLDDALTTAGVSGGALTLGLSRAFGPVTVQPFARGQLGQLRFTRLPSTSYVGAAGGLTILTRF